MIERRYQLFLSLAVILAFLELDCRDTGNGPPPPLKNTRDYTWTMDTIIAVGIINGTGETQTLLTGIWGSSASNVYAIGSNSGHQQNIFHFDGTHWSQISPLPLDGNPQFSSYDLRSIIGFSSSDIWICGAVEYWNNSPPPNFLDSGIVFHYNGATWTNVILPSREGSVNHLWANRPDNVWATGIRAIWHYNGTMWSRDSITLTSGQGTQITSFTQTADGSLYCNAVSADYATYYLYRKLDNWILLDSGNDNNGRWGTIGLWMSPEGTLFSYGIGVYKLSGGSSWTKLFDTQIYGIGNPIGTLGGHDNDLLAAGNYGMIVCYDGVNVFEVKQFENTQTVCTSIFRTSNQVFISGFTIGSGIQVTGFVIRGN